MELFETWDVPGRLLLDEPATTLLLSFHKNVGRSGLWAILHEWREFGVRAQYGSAFTPDQLAAARRSFVHELLRDGFLSRDDAAVLEVGDIDIHRRLPLGYFHDAAALLVLALFLASLAWIPREWRTARRWRALSSGRCPNCGYSLMGLQREICPECGGSTAWR